MIYPVRTQYLTRDYAGVRCRIQTRPKIHYVLEPDENDPVFLVRKGEEIMELEPDEYVLTEDGTRIEPTGRFFRTVSTINPYHAVLDIWDFAVLSY